MLFQIPIAVIGLTQAGIVIDTPTAQAPPLRDRRQSPRWRCYCPGTDPVTTLARARPDAALYELSIIVAALLERRRKRASDPRPG